MKPTYHYVDIGHFKVGERADVLLREHKVVFPYPVWVPTSKVVGLIVNTTDGPVFETMNSIYRPYATDDTPPVVVKQEVVNEIGY